jgi:hypothetical protein
MKIAASLLLFLLLAACIVVDDFGTYWAKGKSDSCINDILYDSMHRDDDQIQMKTITQMVRVITIGDSDFIMMRGKPEDKGGDLIHYRVEGGDYISYRLNENKRGDFLRAHPQSPVVVTEDSATIPLLDAKSAVLLAEIARDESYWMESDRQPYNPKHRPECPHRP